MFKRLKTIYHYEYWKSKECKEYNSLKYRTMIMTGKDMIKS